MAGWFVVNVADAQAQSHERSGSWVRFEDPDDLFPDFGINIHVLQPGQPNGRYHSENQQEDFLVLGGECIAIVEDEEHRLRAWDFIHCPAGTPHIFVGAGEGPCAILMVGSRREDEHVHYPVNELAAKYGASSQESTDSPPVAYADWASEFPAVEADWPLG